MSGDKDDFTNQAIDIILENDTFQERIIEPLKRKVFPYVICITLFNLALFIMIAYMVNRLSVIL
jgi:hypothetical protein